MRRKTARISAAALVLSVGVAFGLAGGACTALPAITAGECGNGFVEPERGEACDTRDAAVCFPPRHEHECRFACEQGPDECRAHAGGADDGWACGLDHVCRSPSGTFQYLTTIPADVLEPGDVSIADVDGDGRGEVITSGPTGATVFAFDEHAKLVRTTNALSVTGRPSVGRLRADAPQSSLAFPISGLGLGIADGDADGTLSARFDTSLSVAATAGVASSLIGVRLLTKGDSSDFSVFTTWRDETSGLAVSALLDVTAAGEQVQVLLPGAELDGSPVTDPTLNRLGSLHLASLDLAEKCPYIVLPFLGETKVHVIPTCDANGDPFGFTPVGPFVVEVALPSSAIVGGRSFVTDINADQVDDLLITSVCPDSSCVRVAYALGLNAGKFGGASYMVDAGVYGQFPTASEDEIAEFAPIAVGDVNEDGSPDFVAGEHIVLTNDQSKWNGVDPIDVTELTRIDAPEGVRWTDAVIADLNFDGRKDVAAGSDERGGIDVYINAGDGAFNHFKLKTTGGARHLVTGDFNGDFITDLAFTMATGGDPSQRSLMAAFGRFLKPPESPIALGDLGDAWQLLAMSNPIPQRPDAMTDMSIVRREAQNGAFGVSVAFGDGASGLTCPLFFSHPTGPELHIRGAPLETAIGSFESDPGLAALTVAEDSEGVELWYVSAAGGHVTAAPGSEQLVPGLTWFSGLVPLSAVDLDAESNPKEELLIAGSYIEGSEYQAMIATARLVSGNFVLDPARVSAGPATELASPLAVGDVDGDGFPDAVATIYDDTSGKLRIVVFWNDPTATGRALSSVTTAVTLDINDNFVLPRPMLVGLDGDRRKEILYTRIEPDADNVYALHTYVVKATARDFGEPVLQPSLDGAYMSVAGDIDGDHIDDLVSIAPGLITVFRGQERAP